MELIVSRPAITLQLARGETLSLDDARGVCITGHSGLFWITQERLRWDDFLCPGTSLVATQPGRTVVEALEHGCLQLSVSHPAFDAGQGSAAVARR